MPLRMHDSQAKTASLTAGLRFIDSKASRLIQLADLIAFSMWRKYEYQDGRFFDPIIGRFDADGGVIHGLVHCKVKGRECYCPACMSRSLYIKEGKSGKVAALGAAEGNVPPYSAHKDQIDRFK
jgi:Protein of unknown function (DUF3800)